MSVQSPIYIMWGLMLPSDVFKPVQKRVNEAADDDDAFHEMCDPYLDSAYDCEPKEGVTILYDGMGGKYLAIGHVLARSGPYGDDLGTHTIPAHHRIADPFADPDNIVMYNNWRNEIEAALKATGLDTAALGLAYGWHVIQHYR